jgi:protein SCO1/2
VESADHPADYLMDHSSIIYLMGPDGTFIKHFNYDVSSDVLAAGLSEVVQ